MDEFKPAAQRPPIPLRLPTKELAMLEALILELKDRSENENGFPANRNRVCVEALRRGMTELASGLPKVAQRRIERAVRDA